MNDLCDCLIAHHELSRPSPSPQPTPSGPPVGPLLRDPGSFIRDLLERVLDLLNQYGALVVAAGALAFLARVVMPYVLWRWRHQLFARDARQVTVFPPPEVDPAGAHELWANLSGTLRPACKRLLLGQPHLSFEYVWSASTVQIRIWVPGVVPPGLVEHAVEAAWPAARTRTSSPPSDPLPSGTVTVGGHLRLARPDWLPLRTGQSADPLRALIGAVSGLAPWQHAVVQVLARPATGYRLGRAHQAASALRSGQPDLRAGRFFDLITPGTASRSQPASMYVLHPERAAQVRAIVDKAHEPQWEARIRYGLTAGPAHTGTTDARGIRALRLALRGRAHALASAYAVYSGHNRLRRRRTWRTRLLLERRWLRRSDLLSVTELAAIAHLPQDPAIEGLTRAGAKSVPAPPMIGEPGADAKTLGLADAGTRRGVALRVTDSRHHVHVLGANGSGKSTLMAQMILSDVSACRGVVLIDPKGDLVVDLLARLPAETASRLVLFDPDDQNARPSLNLLQGPDRNLAVDNVVGIFRRIYADFWGPRTDDILRSSCLTLWDVPAATLADVPRLLSDRGYRDRIISGVRNPVLREFWTWYDSLSDGARGHATGPVLNKLRAFLLRDFIRATIGNNAASIDLADVLNHGGVCLVRASKGALGADASSVFGSLVLAQVWQSITHRARIGESARHDAALYVDEAQNFLTLPHGLADLLAEARGYRLSVTLAHQNLAQLPRELREAVSANARNKVYFAMSPEDAGHLERHVSPNLSAHDLAHLGAFQAAGRLVVDAAETPAFTLRTQPLPATVPGRASLLRRAVRETYEQQPRGDGQTPITGDPRESARRK